MIMINRRLPYRRRGRKFMAELQLLKQSQLRKRAVQSGATDEDLDKADDEVRLLPFSTHKGRG